MLVTLLFLLLLTIIGTSSLYTAYSEAVLSKSIEADARAFYNADSATEQTLYWFYYPAQFTGTPADFFRRRRINNTSFFNEEGISQYTGTKQTPDITYSKDNYTLTVYAPSTPGALCAITSTGMSGRIKRTITVELFEDVSGIKLLRGTWRLD